MPTPGADPVVSDSASEGGGPLGSRETSVLYVAAVKTEEVGELIPAGLAARGA